MGRRNRNHRADRRRQRELEEREAKAVQQHPYGFMAEQERKHRVNAARGIDEFKLAREFDQDLANEQSKAKAGADVKRKAAKQAHVYPLGTHRKVDGLDVKPASMQLGKVRGWWKDPQRRKVRDGQGPGMGERSKRRRQAKARFADTMAQYQVAVHAGLMATPAQVTKRDVARNNAYKAQAHARHRARLAAAAAARMAREA